jgi:hypothetical protein
MGLPPTQQLLSFSSHQWLAMALQDDSTKSVLSSPKIKIGAITECLPSSHCKNMIQTCNPDTTSMADVLPSAAVVSDLQFRATFPNNSFRFVELRTLDFVFPIYL